MATLIYLLVYFIFGSIIGSFLNVVIWRMPRGEDISGRSYCPHCHHALSPWHLVPLFSFLFLRGKCAFCHERVSWRYFIIEAITGLLFVVAGLFVPVYALNDYIVLLRFLFIVSVLVVVFVVDLEHYLILDMVVVPASVVVLVLNIVLDWQLGNSFFSLQSWTGGGLAGALLGAGFFYAIYLLWRGKGMGLGDVKFMIFFGLAAVWPGTLVGMMAAFVTGSLIGGVLVTLGKTTMKTKIPFGTFLALGVLVAMLWGQQLALWYWKLIGL